MRKKSTPQVGPPAEGPHKRLFDKIVDMNSEQDVRDVLRMRHTMNEEMQRTVDKAMKHRQEMKDKTWGRSPSAPRPRAKPKQMGMDSYVARRSFSPPARTRPGHARPPSAAADAEPLAAPAPDLGLKSISSLVENRQKLYTAVTNNLVSSEEVKSVLAMCKWKWRGSGAEGQIKALLQYADELETKHFAPRVAPSPRKGATCGGTPSDRKRKGLDRTANQRNGRTVSASGTSDGTQEPEEDLLPAAIRRRKQTLFSEDEVEPADKVDAFDTMSVKQLKEAASRAGVSLEGLVEKSEVIAAVRRGWMAYGNGGASSRAPAKVTVLSSDDEDDDLDPDEPAPPRPRAKPKAKAKFVQLSDSGEEEEMSDDDSDVEGSEPPSPLTTGGRAVRALLEHSANVGKVRRAAYGDPGSSWGDRSDPNLEPLDNLPLKDYQRAGVRWLGAMHDNKPKPHNAILGDEMGLGKTLQAIAMLLSLHRRKRLDGPVLVVLPTSLLGNWANELGKWAPELKVSKYHGDSRAALRRANANRPVKKPGFDVLLCPYQIFEKTSQSAKIDRGFVGKWSYHALILDEAHCLKDVESNRFKKIAELQARWKLLLTGTVFQNTLKELISVIYFIQPRARFNENQTLQLLDHFTDVEDLDDDERRTRIQQIKAVLTPYILRRLKAEVVKELPPKTEATERVALEGKQLALYSSAIDDCKALKAKPNWVNNKLAHIFSRLRKIANHPLLVRDWYTEDQLHSIAPLLTAEGAFGSEATVKQAFEELTTMSDHEIGKFCREYDLPAEHLLPPERVLDSAKFHLLRRLLPQFRREGHRVLIFSQWTMILELIAELLEALDLSYSYLTGDTPAADRQELVDEYNEPGCSTFAFLLTTRSGGQGLNLVGADTVILHDGDFNPQVDRQAVDRAHRIGQTRPVRVYRMVATGTVDAAIEAISNRKKTLEGSIFGEANKADDRLVIARIMEEALGE